MPINYHHNQENEENSTTSSSTTSSNDNTVQSSNDELENEKTNESMQNEIANLKDKIDENQSRYEEQSSMQEQQSSESQSREKEYQKEKDKLQNKINTLQSQLKQEKMEKTQATVISSSSNEPKTDDPSDTTGTMIFLGVFGIVVLGAIVLLVRQLIKQHKIEKEETSPIDKNQFIDAVEKLPNLKVQNYRDKVIVTEVFDEKDMITGKISKVEQPVATVFNNGSYNVSDDNDDLEALCERYSEYLICIQKEKEKNYQRKH